MNDALPDGVTLVPGVTLDRDQRRLLRNLATYLDEGRAYRCIEGHIWGARTKQGGTCPDCGQGGPPPVLLATWRRPAEEGT